jgi:hypothetical protein
MKRKRLRGFHWHLQQHQQRAAVAEVLDMATMEREQREYQKLGLAPWCISDKPPLAIRKLWLGKLIADFKQWQAQLRQQYPEFYLAV